MVFPIGFFIQYILGVAVIKVGYLMNCNALSMDCNLRTDYGIAILDFDAKSWAQSLIDAFPKG